MPTPAGTAPLYGSRGPGRRSFRIWHPWCGSCSSSFTSRPATSPPGSFSTGMEFQKASSDRCAHYFFPLGQKLQHHYINLFYWEFDTVLSLIMLCHSPVSENYFMFLPERCHLYPPNSISESL